MFGLGLWWLEWASQNTDLCVSNFLLHLWVREIFIENDTFDKLAVRQSSTSFGYNLNEVKVNIFSFKVGNVEDGLNCKISEVVLALTDDL